MSAPRDSQHGQACGDFVELMTAYLDDALPDDLRAEVDRHLDVCSGCRTAITQWRRVVDLTGRLSADDVTDVDPRELDRFTSTLHALRRR